MSLREGLQESGPFSLRRLFHLPLPIAYKPHEIISKFLQPPNLRFEVVQFGFCKPQDFTARRAAPVPRPEDTSELGKRKPHLQRFAYQPHPVERSGRILAVPRARPLRLG